MSRLSVEDEVAAVRRTASLWAAAVERGDLDALGPLMAEDVVVVHGDGRCVSGRDAVLADLASGFARYRIAQTVESEETVVCGAWAFDRARVESTVVDVESGQREQVRSHAWTLLRKDGARGWTVARVIGVKYRTAGTE